MNTQSDSAMTSLWHSRVKTILLLGFLPGTLDLSGAILVYSVIMHKISVAGLCQGIASGVFGKSAYSGGVAMALCGVLFHYLIAFSFAITFFFLFPYLPFLRRQRIINGVLYGVFVWFIMNIIVLPLIFSHRAPMTFESALIAASILIVMIGLPVSLITDKYYSENKTEKLRL